MYLDVKEVKAITARAVASKAGYNIIESIINEIKSAALKGENEVKIYYKEHSISDDKHYYVRYWARICGFHVVDYSDIYVCISW